MKVVHQKAVGFMAAAALVGGTGAAASCDPTPIAPVGTTTTLQPITTTAPTSTTVTTITSTTIKTTTTVAPTSTTSVPSTTTSTSTTVPTSNCNVTPSGGDDTAKLKAAILACSNTNIAQTLTVNGIVDIGAGNDNKTITFSGNGQLKRTQKSTVPTFQVLYFHEVSNLHLINPVITGSNASCQYNAAIEHQHGIELRDVTGTIDGGLIQNMAGDGLYLDGLKIGTHDLTINNLQVNCVGRNDVSVVWSQRVTFFKGVFRNPGFFILDVEPFNTRNVWDLTFDQPSIFGATTWLNVTGPNLSTDIKNVKVLHPIFIDGSSQLWYADARVAGQISITW
jgi:hypothetical protein